MWLNQQFSLLQHRTEDYIIRNVVVCDNYETAGRIAIELYGNDALAIDTTLYPVGIGYTYKDDIFYNLDGEVVPKNPTEAEEIATLKTTIARQNATISELQATLANQDELLADILLNI